MAGCWNPVPAPVLTSTGALAAGALAYFYSGNSSTPITAYSDAGLSAALPWPVVAAINGVFPTVFLPYGNYRVRVTDQYSGLISDAGNIDNNAPPVNTLTDHTAIFNTGYPLWLMQSASVAGFVRLNGNTIGNAASGATELASTTALNLFTYLWQNFTNIIAPVVGGRGLTAAADWAANKQITLPTMAQAFAQGWDGVTPPGTLGGANTATLAIANLPSHWHPVVDAGHVHGVSTIKTAITLISTIAQSSYTVSGGPITILTGYTSGFAGLTGSTDLSGTGIYTNAVGSSTPISIVPQSRIGQWYIKL